MNLTWSSDTAAEWLRAARLVGLPLGEEGIDVGVLLGRLCDLVERKLPPELPDEIEVRPHVERQPISAASLTAFVPSEVPYYEVRVRLGGIAYLFHACRPEPETAGRFAVAMAMLGDRPTLREALTRCRDLLAVDSALGRTTPGRLEALALAERALETP